MQRSFECQAEWCQNVNFTTNSPNVTTYANSSRPTSSFQHQWMSNRSLHSSRVNCCNRLFDKLRFSRSHETFFSPSNFDILMTLTASKNFSAISTFPEVTVKPSSISRISVLLSRFSLTVVRIPPLPPCYKLLLPFGSVCKWICTPIDPNRRFAS